MSISRLLHEFRPFFRMLEEPLTRGAPTVYGLPHRPFLADSFFTSTTVHPALDLTEEAENYIVEAELPGVKKENVDIAVGDGGRSVTIQGRATSPRSDNSSESTAGTGTAQGKGMPILLPYFVGETMTGGTGAVAETPSNRLATERLYPGTLSFTRTVWLPRPVDSSKITAKLVDGVLTLKAPKMEDKESIKINVD